MVNADIPVLQSKLHRPRTTRTLVQRPRLLEKLNNGLARPLSLVCAPAGFGKTTLVSSWIEGMTKDRSIHLPAAWLSLDKNDSDMVVFSTYLIAALRTIFEGACEKTFDLIQAPLHPSLKVITTSLSNEIEELPSNFILVLDDFQAIQGGAVSNLLNDLFLHWPRNAHLVLISRSNPPLSLARLRANGEVTEIRSRDLRFDIEETAEYLSKMLQTPLSGQAVEKLDRKVEGWIGALRLATLSLTGASNLDNLTTTLESSNETLVEYLVDEVLAHQFPAIQAFLLKTSVLDRFNVPLCEALIGEGDPAWGMRACIDWLERAELFIIPLDNHKQWYRYHQLFQDMLRFKLASDSKPEQINELHCKASAWFEEQGLMDEALQHALLANDLDLAASLMERGLRDVLNREDRLTLERWLHMLPDEIMLQRPKLLIIKAWAAQFLWRIDQQSKVLDQVERLIQNAGEEPMSPDSLQLLCAQILALRGQHAYFRNEQALAKSLLHEALGLLPASWEYLRGGIIFYLGLSMYASGEGEAAERLLFDHYDALADKHNIYALQFLYALCFNYLNAGDLEKTQITARALLRGAIECQLHILQSWAHFFLGIVYYQWNNLDEAHQHFMEIIYHRYTGHVAALRDGITGLAIMSQIRGQGSKAWELLEQISEFDLENMGREDEGTRRLRAWLQLLQGDLESAGSWADGFIIPVVDQPSLWIEELHITKVRILLARAENTDLLSSLELLEALSGVAERTHNPRSMIKIQAMRAIALDGLGESGKALVALQNALDLSRPGGFLRVYVDLGVKMEALLKQLVEQNGSVDYIQRILAAFQDQKSIRTSGGTSARHYRRPSIDVPELAEPLTARELDALALLREPMSIKEIATRLGISMGTVKRHTINLYGKLGVHTRWEAVAKAEQLMILPPR
jgi:ATP/maltotriose-dependent transcriptional regulator MalT